MIRSIALTALALGLAACQVQEVDNDRPETAREFPRAYRPVSELAGSTFSTEEQRDDRNEANTVMDLAQIRPGMTVADLGEVHYGVGLVAVVALLLRRERAPRQFGNRTIGPRKFARGLGSVAFDLLHLAGGETEGQRS